jgi:hypothetical protein
MDASKYRDSYFRFGSACRALAGKIPAKDWKATLEDIWAWSKRKVEELHVDVADFAPPAKEEPPPPTAALPVEYINDIQAQKFKERCLKLGLTEEGMRLFLKAHGIEDIPTIPLSDIESLCYLVRSTAVKKP